jgi:hypothetical protein
MHEGGSLVEEKKAYCASSKTRGTSRVVMRKGDQKYQVDNMTCK